jgi:hypothetical protein
MDGVAQMFGVQFIPACDLGLCGVFNKRHGDPFVTEKRGVLN